MGYDDVDPIVMDRISDILVVLSEVATGTFGVRLKTLPEGDAWGALFDSINEVVDKLATAHDESERYQSELQQRLETIEQQRVAISELSTPVIEVWKGVLCLPLVGVMDTSRSTEMTEALLHAVVGRKARCAIIDVTGIHVMDTATVDHFLRMARSVRLIGAECILTGVSPHVAQTISHMGVELTGVSTQRSLRDALARYLRQTHLGAHSKSGPSRGPIQNGGNP